MDAKKNVVDVSCFFIFEATGDSEADQFDDPNKATGTNIDRDSDGGDFNDAESCSHDDDNFPFDNNNNNNEANGSFYNNAKVCIDDDDEEEEEGEEVHSYYPAWRHEPRNNNNNYNGKKISNVDSSHEELLSEMEKNKLFWDTCLAS